MFKKILLGFVIVFVLLQVTNLVIHYVILGPAYEMEPLKSSWRPDMESKMWIMHVTGLIFAFFYTLIYSKYTKGKGVGEGLLFGLFTGFMIAIPMAYNSYVTWPLPYPIAFQWFIYGMIQYLLFGIFLGIIFKQTIKEIPAQ